MFYIEHMERQVPVRELNQQTSAVLAAVAGGQAVTVTRAGRPIARLVPVQDGETWLLGLVSAGRATAAMMTRPFTMPPADNYGGDVSERLADDRRDERW